VRDEGRADELDDWLARLDEQALRSSPHAAVVAARLHAHRGRTADAERCLGLARNGAKPKAALVRAALCANGPETMLADAERGLAGLGREDRWHAYGLLLSGTAHSLLGAAADADAVLAEAVHSAGRTGAAETLLLARCQRALAAGEHVPETKGFDDYATMAPALALAAQEALRAGLWADARGAITRAQALMPGLTDALPWLAVQARLALASAHVMLRDADSARALLGEADLILAVRDLGRLQAERDALAKEIGSIPPSRDGHATRLTGAELRLLPLLATHLSFREIGARLFLSRHTVKTQAISAYRKLGATSRKEAVVRASQLGLIEPVSDLQSLAA